MTASDPPIFNGARLVDELSPTIVESYLGLTGWEQTFRRDGVNAVWDRGDASLMLPYDPDFADFAPRFAEALQAISIVEQVRGESLALEILSSENDIIFLRADQGVARGSIPLTEAEELVSGARQMLLAAACSAIDRRANFRGRKPEIARNFVEDDARMGHTLQGSFVLTIFASIAHTAQRSEARPNVNNTNGDVKVTMLAEDEPATVEDAVEAAADAPPVEVGEPYRGSATSAGSVLVPYARRATATLASGLQAADLVLRESPQIDLGTAVERGASAELIDSLELMGTFQGLQALDLSFKWSKSLPRDPDASDRTVLSRSQIESHALETSSTLKRRDVKGRIEVIGKVVQLEREEDNETGVVVVEGYMNNTRRKVRASFSGTQYATAIRAHEERTSVTVTGDVGQRGNRYWLTNATLWSVRDKASTSAGDDDDEPERPA